MASLNMFNKGQQNLPSTCPLSPRISFSNDFVDTQQAYKHECCYREAPVSSDFEFSAAKFSMMSADQLFFKGKLLPSKKTLRDELLEEDEFDEMLLRPPKDSTRRVSWLGLKRGQNASKYVNTGVAEKKVPASIHEAVKASQTMQELLMEDQSVKSEK